MNVKGSVNSSKVTTLTFDKSHLAALNSLDAKDPTNPDDAIKASILSTLTWYSHTPIDDVRVFVKNGYVTLNGIVQWMYQKMVIAAMVQQVDGVMGIINSIDVAHDTHKPSY